MHPATILAALAAGLAFLPQEAPLGEEEFTRHHEALTKAEKWATIPWQADLIAAHSQSIKEKKPLFIWAMDGKPLGSV